jgi:hypothetical protein
MSALEKTDIGNHHFASEAEPFRPENLQKRHLEISTARSLLQAGARGRGYRRQDGKMGHETASDRIFGQGLPWLRRLDRFFTTRLLWQRYEFILPGKIKR